MAKPAAALDAEATLGDLLRYWRRVRSMSQLDLASAAMTTPRHMSFVETGRSNPSREMVLRLASALDVPLRDRNGLLLAAGYAPLYVERGLDHPALDRVDAAISTMLAQHEPLPAVVMDRGWNLLRVNTGAQRLFTGLFAPEAVPASANVLRVILEPGPARSRITNWHELAPALLDRARREAVGGVLDLATAVLVPELRSRPDVESVLSVPRTSAPPSPVIDIHVEYADTDLRFFSVVSTIGTPVDVTAQELRVEAFFPADDVTAQRWGTLAGH